MREYLDFFKNTFNIKDTASRGDYWLAILDNIIILLLLLYLVDKSDIFSIVFILYCLLTIIPTITLNCRRLNDLELPRLLILINLTALGIFAYIILMFLPSKHKKNDSSNKIYYDFDNISKENSNMNYDIYDTYKNIDYHSTEADNSNFFE